MAQPHATKQELRQRIRDLIGMLLELSPIAAEQTFRDKYGCSHHTWLRYYARAMKKIESAASDQAAICKDSIIARHLDNYATAGTRDRVRILAELSKLTGSYSPIQTVQTTLSGTDQLPAATAALMANGAVREALLAAEEGAGANPTVSVAEPAGA